MTSKKTKMVKQSIFAVLLPDPSYRVNHHERVGVFTNTVDFERR